MNIIDQIIDLNTVAMMGNTELERFYVTAREFEEISRCGPRRQTSSELRDVAGALGFNVSPGLKGFIDGVAIIVVGAKV